MEFHRQSYVRGGDSPALQHMTSLMFCVEVCEGSLGSGGCGLRNNPHSSPVPLLRTG